MKNQKRNICALLIVFLAAFLSNKIVFAENRDNFSEIISTLDVLFDMRSNKELCDKSEEKRDLFKQIEFSDRIKEDLAFREKCLADMEDRIHAEFIDISSEYQILDMVETDGSVELTVLEIVTIHYQYPRSTIIDEMAYAPNHIIELEISDNMIFVKSDSFNEYMVTGAYSGDFEDPEKNYTLNKSMIEMVSNQNGNTPAKTFSNYNAASAVSYANQWWNSHNSSYTDYDNDGYDTTSDCANFVSQCMKNGGAPDINYGNYTGGWYKDSYPWVNVGGFDSFWQGQGYTRYNANGSNANMGNCIPGNPVYYLNTGSGFSGHAALCVGHNSQGIPIVNAHSPAAYHVPITSSPFSSNSLYTLKFKSCSHSGVTYTALGASTHMRICNSCSNSLIQNHSWNYLASYQECKKCGYRLYNN